MIPKKKLIEVALPLDAINKASGKEKAIRHGHPSTMHLWWARRPLSAARAVVFAQMVDDPSAHPDLFPTARAQEKERRRLFHIIENLVQWESTTDERILQAARDEIWQSWRATCAENVDHPLAKELFDRYKLPGFCDPFAGGGTLPLEAQRLGLKVYASDLNPVAVLINKAMIEIPQRFSGKPPVNPEVRNGLDRTGSWTGAQGLASDVRYYGRWMRDEAERRIGHLYPKVEVTVAMAQGRPDLKPLIGHTLTVVAWHWARTVKSPNPAYAQVDVPLASTFMLCAKQGKEVYVEPVIESGAYRFNVKVGKPPDPRVTEAGTKLARANFRCIMSGAPIPGDYIKAEGTAGRIGARLLALVAEAAGGRVYLPPTDEMERVAREAKPRWKPEGEIVEDARAFTPTLYGLSNWSDLFTPRQLVALTTYSDLVEAAGNAVRADGLIAGLQDDYRRLEDNGAGASAYADALRVYLSFAVDKMTDTNTNLCSWQLDPPRLRATFGRQALSMVWDYAEANIFGDAAGDFGRCVQSLAEVLDRQNVGSAGQAFQMDAAAASGQEPLVFSTDPPYYDNVPYADLSDFFYVWLRRSLKDVLPTLFSTVAVPKEAELVAVGYRHGGKERAEAFFLDGMTRVMHRIAVQAHPAFPVTIYYAFKQAEGDEVDGTVSTGWETFLDAVLRAGFSISGTWPMRSEWATRNRGRGSNALASSIVIVCRRRPGDAPTATRREFLSALQDELPTALAHLQRSNIAPVDLAQAAIGPGMAVYSNYSKILDAEGKPLTVHDALALINQTLDEALAKQEGDLDADSRWALAWFEQSGFAEGEYGAAETLSKAKNTSVKGLEEAGILKSSRGKARLLKANELPADWDPATDPRLTAWEVVHHLIRAMDAGGELGAAALVAKLGAKAEVARELAYRLYTLCERKRRAPEAQAYNGLVQSWPEIARLAREGSKGQRSAQAGLFDKNEE